MAQGRFNDLSFHVPYFKVIYTLLQKHSGLECIKTFHGFQSFQTPKWNHTIIYYIELVRAKEKKKKKKKNEARGNFLTTIYVTLMGYLFALALDQNFLLRL